MIDDRGFTIINVYAPIQVSKREKLFSSLEAMVTRAGGPVLLCGDFNCTLLEARDWSFKSRRNKHDSPALRQLLRRGALIDVLDDDLEADGIEDVYTEAHTAIREDPFKKVEGEGTKKTKEEWKAESKKYTVTRKTYDERKEAVKEKIAKIQAEM